MTAYWNTLTLTGDPILVVGLRPKTKIIGYRVTVDRNLHPDLRKIADDALAIVKKRKGIKYTPYVEPGDDEYLELAPSTLTITKTKTNPSGTTSQKQRTARLLEIIRRHAAAARRQGADPAVGRVRTPGRVRAHR